MKRPLPMLRAARAASTGSFSIWGADIHPTNVPPPPLTKPLHQALPPSWTHGRNCQPLPWDQPEGGHAGIWPLGSISHPSTSQFAATWVSKMLPPRSRNISVWALYKGCSPKSSKPDAQKGLPPTFPWNRKKQVKTSSSPLLNLAQLTRAWGLHLRFLEVRRELAGL